MTEKLVPTANADVEAEFTITAEDITRLLDLEAQGMRIPLQEDKDEELLEELTIMGCTPSRPFHPHVAM
ncbi:MAG: hypothetical protein GXO55_09650 [Chloroflexi bacterium]|nr:hypothetical protein [Chloroflexota bacterium]